MTIVLIKYINYFSLVCNSSTTFINDRIFNLETIQDNPPLNKLTVLDLSIDDIL